MAMTGTQVMNCVLEALVARRLNLEHDRDTAGRDGNYAEAIEAAHCLDELDYLIECIGGELREALEV